MDTIDKEKGAYGTQSGAYGLARKNAIDDAKVRNVWRAFGSYIAKQLTNGKGVDVPRFGQFTFTAAEVNLQGTTNPQARDK